MELLHLASPSCTAEGSVLGALACPMAGGTGRPDSTMHAPQALQGALAWAVPAVVLVTVTAPVLGSVGQYRAMLHVVSAVVVVVMVRMHHCPSPLWPAWAVLVGSGNPAAPNLFESTPRGGCAPEALPHRPT